MNDIQSQLIEIDNKSIIEKKEIIDNFKFSINDTSTNNFRKIINIFKYLKIKHENLCSKNMPNLNLVKISDSVVSLIFFFFFSK